MNRLKPRHCRNKSAPTSKYKGVSYDGGMRKFKAMLRINGQFVRSFFFHEEDAAKEYDSMVRIKCGEYGRYNFPMLGERSALTAGEPARRGAGA